MVKWQSTLDKAQKKKSEKFETSDIIINAYSHESFWAQMSTEIYKWPNRLCVPGK